MSDDKIALNLSKLVSAGLQSGLSSITTKVGEQLLGYGLNALLGTQFGTDQQLTEILNSLTSVNNSLAAIDSDLKQLMQQLSLTEQILNINGMLDSVGDDLSNITTSWGSFVGYVKKGSIEASELKDLLGNILGDGDAMANALTSIGTLLITNSPTTHNRKGLLDAWVDFALSNIQGAKVAPSGDTIKTWFQYFENNLMYLVQQLYQGMILNVNALVVQSCQQQCSDPNSQNCQDCLLNSPGTSGSDYLTMLFYPLMKGIMEQYNQSMNRFVLRFYDPTTFATAPEFLDTELLNYIWTRVDLLTSLTLATPKAPENPGFSIRAYLRPSQITTPASGPKQGPPVTPPGYSQKTGKVIPPPPLYTRDHSWRTGTSASTSRIQGRTISWPVLMTATFRLSSITGSGVRHCRPPVRRSAAFRISCPNTTTSAPWSRSRPRQAMKRSYLPRRQTLRRFCRTCSSMDRDGTTRARNTKRRTTRRKATFSRAHPVPGKYPRSR